MSLSSLMKDGSGIPFLLKGVRKIIMVTDALMRVGQTYILAIHFVHGRQDPGKILYKESLFPCFKHQGLIQKI